MQVQFAGGVIDWNVMLGGIDSVKVGPLAVLAGPSFVIFWVKVTLLPAVTEVADGILVNTRVASPAAATTSVAVALLLEELGSLVAELTVAVSVKLVP